MTRPPIATIKTGEELKKWYWLKSEVIEYARQTGVSYTGSKFTIIDRLAHKLDGTEPVEPAKNKAKSTGSWANLILTPDTVLTSAYTNGSNSRAFFREHGGQKFTFTISFMNWLKNNAGKTLRDAVAEYKRLNDLTTDPNARSDIPAGNQYNQYMRDFFADNPGRPIDEARQCWKRKRDLPLGRHVYERSDLDLTDNG